MKKAQSGKTAKANGLAAVFLRLDKATDRRIRRALAQQPTRKGEEPVLTPSALAKRYFQNWMPWHGVPPARSTGLPKRISPS